MGPGSHLQIGYLIANAASLNTRDRRLVMLAGVAPDVDGVVGIFDIVREGRLLDCSYSTFHALHHTFGHNVFFGVFGALLLGAAAAGAKGRVFWLCLAAMASHYAADAVAADYPLNLLWPLGGDMEPIPILLGASPWVVKYVIQFSLMIVILALCAWMVARTHRTPVEVLSPQLDRFLVGYVVGAFTTRCGLDTCGNRGGFCCSGCGVSLCGVHAVRRRGLDFWCPTCKNERHGAEPPTDASVRARPDPGQPGSSGTAGGLHERRIP